MRKCLEIQTSSIFIMVFPRLLLSTFNIEMKTTSISSRSFPLLKESIDLKWKTNTFSQVLILKILESRATLKAFFLGLYVTFKNFKFYIKLLVRRKSYKSTFKFLLESLIANDTRVNKVSIYTETTLKVSLNVYVQLILFFFGKFCNQ